MRVTIMRNIETFPWKQMYPYLSLDERKVAEFYHNIDRRSWLVWVKMTYIHRFFRTIPGVLEKHVLSHRGKWHDNRPIFTNDAQFELFWSPDMRSSCCYQVFTVRSFSMVRKWLLYRECESPYDGRGLACLIPLATSFSSGNLRCS